MTVTTIVIALFFLPSTHADPQEKIPFDSDDSIEEIRVKIEQNGYSFTVDNNWVFDMSPDEKNRFFSRKSSTRLKSYKISQGPGPLKEMLGRKAPPSTFDWRSYFDSDIGSTVSYIGPVRNQQSCGSCYSFGATAAFEGTYNFTNKYYDDNAVDFSEAFLAFCLSEHYEGFDGCDGSDYEYEELEALSDYGLPLETAFPYNPDSSVDCNQASWEAPREMMDYWYRVPSNDIDAIKTAISTYGVIDVAVEVTNAFEAYSSGVFEDTNTTCPDAEYTTSNHAVSLVGWDNNPPEGGGGVWILRNSWGESWGEDGYMRIRYTSAAVACATTYLEPGEWQQIGTGDATNNNISSVTVSGTITPRTNNYEYCDWWFEYAESIEAFKEFEYEESDGGWVINTADTYSISEKITGLKTGAQYYYRLVSDYSQGEIKTFYTAATAPGINNTSTANIGKDQAEISATINPSGATTQYYFEYGETTSYGSSSLPIDIAPSTDDVAVDLILENLHPASEYHFRVVATNNVGKTMSDDNVFTTLAAPPLIQVNGIENISAEQAQINVLITPLNSESIAFIEYGTSTDYGNYSDIINIGSGRDQSAVAMKLTNLTAATNYHYRLVASNIAGMTYGNDMTFTTDAAPPHVTTISADEIGSQAAQINAWVNPRNSETTYYFEYGPTTSYGSLTASINAGAGGALIDANQILSNLEIATEYHYRIVAINIAGTSYGDDISFTTAVAAPSVREGSVDDILTIQAIISSYINGYGSDTIAHIEYGETNSYGSTTPPVSIGSANGEVLIKTKLTALNPNTTYHYRVVATNSAGTTYGEDAVFETNASSSRCFIATAAFGSPMEQHVQILRDFRDKQLLTNTAGTIFVDYYYKKSPPLANIIAKHKGLRQLTRLALKPLIDLAYILKM